MAGIIGSTSPCVQVVDTYVHFFYNAPGLPTNAQFTTRKMYVFKLLITCPGIWTLDNASFTYTNPWNETAPMTMVDLNNIFPVVLPENETIEVEVAWDYHWDGILGQGINPGGYSSVVQYALNYCVSLQFIPFGGIEPPPPPPGSDYPPNDIYPYPLSAQDFEDLGIELPGEAAATGNNSGENSNPQGDTGAGSEPPAPYNTSSTGFPHHDVPNIPVAGMYRLTKLNVGGKFLGDPKDTEHKPGNRPAKYMSDLPSTKKPIAGIGEPREIYFTQLYNKSSLKENSFGPGQSFAPRVKNSDAVQDLIYAPNRSKIVGKRTNIKTTLLTDKSVGNKVNINSATPNPDIDINTKELHGSDSSVTNFNVYVTKDPKAGSRLEKMPPYHYRQENKTDSNGRPLKSSQTRKDGAANTAPKSGFNLFSTRIPKDKNIPFISRKSTRQLASTSGTEGYLIPLANENFTIVDDSNVIYNGGQGLFYGVGPFETIESDEFLEGLYNLNPFIDGIQTFVSVNESLIVESNVVTPASIGIQNISFHQTMHNTLVVIGILDSEAVFRYLGYNYINILPRSYQFMTAVIPPGLPPGAAKVVGMVFNFNNELVLSETEDVIIAPDGFTVEGYTPQSPYLPSTLLDLAGNPEVLHGGRVFDKIGKRRYKATASTVDIVSKSPQIAINRGLDTKITTVYSDNTDTLSTSSSTSRYTIDGVEVFPGSHDAYLQINTNSGNTVDIKVSDAQERTHSTYAYNIFASNLELPDLVFSGIANESGYLGGHIQTNVINGKVFLQNARTTLACIRHTTESGYLILNTLSGYNQAGNVVTQVDLTETPYLGFDTLPGDNIKLYADGIGGNFNELLLSATLLPDGSLELPTSEYTLPDDAFIPVAIPDPINAGSTIPNTNYDPDPPPLPGTDPDNPDPLPPPPPGNPMPTNGECQVPGTEETSWKIQIISVCQRPSNPCTVDIVADIHACDQDGNPIIGSDDYAVLMEELCSFSIDSTNGLDGTWYQLIPLITDSQHTGPGHITLPGTYNFVADMCDHFSAFFSTDNIMFKLAFRRGELGAGGGFVGDCTVQEILS